MGWWREATHPHHIWSPSCPWKVYIWGQAAKHPCWIQNPYCPSQVFIFWVGGWWGQQNLKSTSCAWQVFIFLGWRVVGPAESEVHKLRMKIFMVGVPGGWGSKLSSLNLKSNSPWELIFAIGRDEANCLTDKVLQLKYGWSSTICPTILLYKMCEDSSFVQCHVVHRNKSVTLWGITFTEEETVESKFYCESMCNKSNVSTCRS